MIKMDYIVVFFFQDRISLCIPDCFSTRSVDEAGLSLLGICLPLPSKCCLKACATMHDMKEYFFVVVVKEKPVIPCGKFQRNDQTTKMFFIEFMHLKFYLGSAVGKENTTNPSDLSLSFPTQVRVRCGFAFV